ncbi:divalent-cation tolerance protein CutA [Limnobacter sp.]|uniref:divalent-cation tolerance protein CutA n=1 Tax=Limnobacter sp. TaxID=2003368 RepID=UPI00351308B0
MQGKVPTEVWLAYCTWPARNLADQFAANLVERGLAACAAVSGPISSHYLWQGQVEQSEEWLVTIKCCSSQREALKAYTQECHPYEVPELLMVEVGDGLPEYLQWVRDSAGNA